MGGDRDKNDPSFWTEPREFKLAKLEEEDKSTRFDRPPLKGSDEIAEEMKYKRTIKVKNVVQSKYFNILSSASCYRIGSDIRLKPSLLQVNTT